MTVMFYKRPKDIPKNWAFMTATEHMYNIQSQTTNDIHKVSTMSIYNCFIY